MATLNRYKRPSAEEVEWTVDCRAGAGGKSEREKKHRDLTYCLPLSNDSVFKRPYGGCATRHPKINDERSNQTSIRPCPGQIFGGSIGVGLYFIFRFHSRPQPPPSGSHDCRTYYIYILSMCTYAYLYVCMGNYPPPHLTRFEPPKPLWAGVTVYCNSVRGVHCCWSHKRIGIDLKNKIRICILDEGKKIRNSMARHDGICAIRRRLFVQTTITV